MWLLVLEVVWPSGAPPAPLLRGNDTTKPAVSPRYPTVFTLDRSI